MNPFDIFPNAVRHGRLSPGYLVNSKTGAGLSWGDIAVDVIIDSAYTLSEVAPFGQDGDILIYLKPSRIMFHTPPGGEKWGADGPMLDFSASFQWAKPSESLFQMTPDEIAGGSLTIDDSPDGLPQGNVTGGRYHIMSVAYGRDQDTGHVIDYELTCKPEGAGA